MLTPAQQSALDYHLRETNLLTNEELILELTDHYTAALIERMTQGVTFEAALADIQRDFGGRKGLQKMERVYNKVTFRHYDQRWIQALIAQFQKPLLWTQTLPIYAVLLLLTCIAYMPAEVSIVEGEKWNLFFNGFTLGSFMGFIFPLLGIAWPFLKAISRRGIHNVPTEALYLLTRHLLLLPILYGIGSIGYYWLLPLLPYPFQAIVVSVSLAVIGLYMRTGNMMYESLYDIYSTR